MKKNHVIPPLSVVRLFRSDANTPHWKNQIGRIFRVGYYSRADGIDCLWLVNEEGQYEQSVDQSQLLDYFQVVLKSNERSLFGRNRLPIPPLNTHRKAKHTQQKSSSRAHA